MLFARPALLKLGNTERSLDTVCTFLLQDVPNASSIMVSVLIPEGFMRTSTPGRLSRTLMPVLSSRSFSCASFWSARSSMQTSASHFFSISRNKDIPEPSPQAAATAPAIDPAKVPSGTTLRDNAIDKISRENLHWLAFSSAPASSVNVEPSGPASVFSEKLVNTCKARSHLPAALHVPIAQLYVMTSGSKARALGADNRSNFPQQHQANRCAMENALVLFFVR